MSSKAGIWVDHKHAVVVLHRNDEESIKEFEVDSSGHGDSLERPAYTRNDFVSEDNRKRKEALQCRRMYELVLESLNDVDSLFVIGPGEAKLEFVKLVQGKHGSSMSVESQAADKMTIPQLAAKVRTHFSAKV